MFWIANHYPGLTSKRLRVNYCLPWLYKLRNFRQHHEGSSTVNIDSTVELQQNDRKEAWLHFLKQGKVRTHAELGSCKNVHVLKWNNWNS